MKLASALFFVFNCFSFLALGQDTDLKTVPSVDISRYMGTWYQISGNPTEYEKSCLCSRQKLEALADGTVSVYNSCTLSTVSGPLSEIKGIATNVHSPFNSRFTVDFGLGKLGNYWIIALDPEYNWAVVSEPTRKSLFVISKTPQMSTVDYSQALTAAGSQTDISLLQPMEQMNCSYPQ